MEFEDIKEALEYLFDVSQSTGMVIRTHDSFGLKGKRVATAKDMQDIMFEVVVSVSDLLGFPEIYLEEEKK